MRQALKKWFSSDRRLIAFCYAAFFAASLLYSLYGFGEDRVQRALGGVEQQEVRTEDFALTDLAEGEDGVLVSQSPDPRMVLRQVPEYVRSVTVDVEFVNMDPGEFCVFYMPKAGMEDFDANYRVWAYNNGDGSYTFTLPRGKVYGLRMDPGIYTGIEMRIERIALNAPRSFLSWFTPSRTWLLAQAAVPLLAAALIKAILGAFCAVKAIFAKKRGV